MSKGVKYYLRTNKHITLPCVAQAAIEELCAMKQSIAKTTVLHRRILNDYLDVYNKHLKCSAEEIGAIDYSFMTQVECKLQGAVGPVFGSAHEEG